MVKTLELLQYEEYASQLVEKHYQAKTICTQYLSGSARSIVYCVQFDQAPFCCVVKLYLVPTHHTREAADLALIRGATTAKLPEVYFLHDADEEIPVDACCMEYITGENAVLKTTLMLNTRSKRKAFAEAVVSSLLEIHSVTGTRFGRADSPMFDSWDDYYRPRAQKTYDAVSTLAAEGKLPLRLFRVIDEAWQHYEDIFAEKDVKPVLLHGDVNMLNLMVDASGDFIGFVDAVKATWGDREYDLYQLRSYTAGRFALYETYKKRYAVSPNCDIKTAFYALIAEAYAFSLSPTIADIGFTLAVRRMKAELRKRGY